MLTIITITRNDVNGLKKTLESTRSIRSEWENIEQLVIDGSDEETALKNQNATIGLVKVNYMKREPQGISDAFNFGILKAKFKWFWFLNGGDQLNQSLDLIFFQSLLTQVEADILIFQHQLMQKGTIVRFPSIHKTFPPVLPWIPHPATIIKNDIFTKYGHFDEKYKIAMDYELWLRLYGKKVVVNLISIPIASYDENGLSSTQIGSVNYEGREILKIYKMKLLRLWLNAGKNILKQYVHFNKSANED